MLISPIQLTEWISFCDSGVLAFDVIVSVVLEMFQMLTKVCVVGGGDLFIPCPNSMLNIQRTDCTSLQSKFPKHNCSLGTNHMKLSLILAKTAAL